MTIPSSQKVISSPPWRAEELSCLGSCPGRPVRRGAVSRPLRLLSVDPTMAAAVGMSPRGWSVVSAIWLGAAIGLSIRVSGMLYTFGCLVLPALAARNLRMLGTVRT